MDTVKKVELDKNLWHDDRGWGIDSLQALNLPKRFSGNLHIVSLKPGAVRGNHYHANATEWILVFGGPTKLIWKTKEANTTHQFSVTNSEPALFEVPPNIEHAIVNDSVNEIYLAVFYDSHEPDQIPCASLIDVPE